MGFARRVRFWLAFAVRPLEAGFFRSLVLSNVLNAGYHGGGLGTLGYPPLFIRGKIEVKWTIE